MKDLNYSAKHVVLKDETLSDIMLNYYGSKSFNNNILSLAIVHFNKKAFVRNNPNYLYSGKKLYLPSINEIKDLIIKIKKLINSKSIINFGAIKYRKDQVMYMNGNNKKLKNKLNWNPEISLESGLMQTIKNIRKLNG